MAVEPVGWELTPGLTAVRNLRRMLIEVLARLGFPQAPGQSAQNIEVYFHNRKCTIGVDINHPDRLMFSVSEAIAPSRLAADWEPRYGWLHRYLTLNSEVNHFFARTAESQADLIQAFVQRCLEECEIPAPRGQD